MDSISTFLIVFCYADWVLEIKFQNYLYFREAEVLLIQNKFVVIFLYGIVFNIMMIFANFILSKKSVLHIEMHVLHKFKTSYYMCTCTLAVHLSIMEKSEQLRNNF